MLILTIERAFRRFQATGDPRALAVVFDRAVPRLRGLAQHLASAETSAEDLLQSTFLTAIEAKHEYDASQPLLPWLAGILANHARVARRRGRRELDPARLRSELGLDPGREAASAELSETLERAIAGLEEHYRSVLRLHLQHGLEPAEIALALERPQGTVRSQLSRGLEQLRAKLPRTLAALPAFALVSPGSVAAIRARVLEHCGGSGVAIASAAALGTLALTLQRKLLLTACVLLALVFFALRSPWSSLATKQLALPLTSEAPAIPSVLAPDASAERLAASPGASGSIEPANAVPASTGSLRVHVKTVHGAPLANIGVGLEFRSVPNHVTQPEFIPTNAEGDAFFEAVPAGEYSVRLDRGLGCFTEVIAGQHTDVETWSHGGTDVSGIVVDEHGSPIEGASIWHYPDQRVEGMSIGQTDAQGRFSIDQVCGILLQARRAGYAPSKACPMLHPGNGRAEMRLVLESAAGDISGRVVDDESQPLAGVVVAFQLEAANSRPLDEYAVHAHHIHVRTAADGTYRCTEVPRGNVIVTAVSVDMTRVPASVLLDVGGIPLQQGFRLGRGAVLEGTVTVGDQSDPSSSLVVSRLNPGMPMSYWLHGPAMRFSHCDEEGHYRMSGILPGEITVGVSRGLELGSLRTMTVAGGEVAHWDFDWAALQGAPFVIDVDPPRPPGTVPVWKIFLHATDPTDTYSNSVATDEVGRARVEQLPAGHYTATLSFGYVTAELMGSASLTVLVREFDASEQHLALHVPDELLHYKAVRGRLVDSAGTGLPGRMLRLQSSIFPVPPRLLSPTGTQGMFRFEPLAAGHYTLEQFDGETATVVGEFTVQGEEPEELGSFTGH